ncbi:MAG: hypothetical protein AAF378_09110 [Cyanobacteria bacterium P01_A01_bin.84]
MRVKWKKLLVKSSAWLVAEVMLNAVGLDNIADYSEFISQNQVITQTTEVLSNLITLVS